MEENTSKTTPEELRNQIEAILFASGKKLNVHFIKNITEVDNVRKVKNALQKIKDWYDEHSKVLMITEEGDYWKINVRENYSDIVRKIVSETDLSKSILETLSVIAWKSPVYQSEVVNIRSAGAYDHISALEEAGFVTKEKQGRSYILKVTQRFFDYFDIEGNEGIKEVFAKIKEKPIQQKINDESYDSQGEELSNIQNSETSDASNLDEGDYSEDNNQEPITKEEIKKVGEFDVINVEEKEQIINHDDNEESVGKLEVYDDEDMYSETQKNIFEKGELEKEDHPNNYHSIEEREEDIEEDIEEERQSSERTKTIVKELLAEDEIKEKSKNSLFGEEEDNETFETPIENDHEEDSEIEKIQDSEESNDSSNPVGYEERNSSNPAGYGERNSSNPVGDEDEKSQEEELSSAQNLKTSDDSNPADTKDETILSKTDEEDETDNKPEDIEIEKQTE